MKVIDQIRVLEHLLKLCVIATPSHPTAEMGWLGYQEIRAACTHCSSPNSRRAYIPLLTQADHYITRKH